MWTIGTVERGNSKDLVISDGQHKALLITSEELFDDNVDCYITIFDAVVNEVARLDFPAEAEKFDRLYIIDMEMKSSKLFTKMFALAAISKNNATIFGRYTGTIGFHRMSLSEFVDIDPMLLMQNDSFSLFGKQVKSAADLRLALYGLR